MSGGVRPPLRARSRGLAVYALGDSAPHVHATAWVADNAAVIGNVHMQEDSSVWFGATVRGDNDPITIGSRTNIQDGSVLHSDHGAPLTIGADGKKESLLRCDMRRNWHKVCKERLCSRCCCALCLFFVVRR